MGCQENETSEDYLLGKIEAATDRRLTFEGTPQKTPGTRETRTPTIEIGQTRSLRSIEDYLQNDAVKFDISPLPQRLFISFSRSRLLRSQTRVLRLRRRVSAARRMALNHFRFDASFFPAEEDGAEIARCLAAHNDDSVPRRTARDECLDASLAKSSKKRHQRCQEGQ